MNTYRVESRVEAGEKGRQSKGKGRGELIFLRHLLCTKTVQSTLCKYAHCKGKDRPLRFLESVCNAKVIEIKRVRTSTSHYKVLNYLDNLEYQDG